MRVLVTGSSGALGRRVVHRLVEHGHEVIGLDRRQWPDAPKGVRMVQTDLRKRPAEDVFRSEQPEGVIHMATVSHLAARAEERYRINLGGTRAVFEHCHTYGVKQAVFVGRHTTYGAAPDAPLYHAEDDPPLAVHTFPELSDLVAADLYAGSALWRYPEVSTAVLRLVYTLGPDRHGTLAAYLRGPRVPTILGYDPLFQFMHEQDAADAIVVSLERRLRGMFNVAGPPPVPLSVLIREAGRRSVAMPEMLAPFLLGKLGLPPLPPGALEHIKYPVVVDDALFRSQTDFAPAFDEAATIGAFREAVPLPGEK